MDGDGEVPEKVDDTPGKNGHSVGGQEKGTGLLNLLMVNLSCSGNSFLPNRTLVTNTEQGVRTVENSETSRGFSIESSVNVESGHGGSV